jgi:hypothetical protein
LNNTPSGEVQQKRKGETTSGIVTGIFLDKRTVFARRIPARTGADVHKLTLVQGIKVFHQQNAGYGLIPLSPEGRSFSCFFFNAFTSHSRRAYRWASSLFRSVSLDITTEKWRLMKIRNTKANKKIVDEGIIAPIEWVIHFNRSNHKVSRRMTHAVTSHNHEYSSRSFLLLTNSITRKSIPTPTARATMIFRTDITSSFFHPSFSH